MLFAKLFCSPCFAPSRASRTRKKPRNPNRNPDLLLDWVAPENDVRVVGGFALSAVTKPACGVAHRDVARNCRGRGWSYHTRHRPVDEHRVSPGDSRSFAERHGAHQSEAHRTKRHPRLP